MKYECYTCEKLFDEDNIILVGMKYSLRTFCSSCYNKWKAGREVL